MKTLKQGLHFSKRNIKLEFSAVQKRNEVDKTLKHIWNDPTVVADQDLLSEFYN